VPPPTHANSHRGSGATPIIAASSSRRTRRPPASLAPLRATSDTAREARSTGRVQRGAPRKPAPSSSSDASAASRRGRGRPNVDDDTNINLDTDPDLSSAFARLKPAGPPPVFPSAAPPTIAREIGGRVPRLGDYAAAAAAAGFAPGGFDERADPRLVKPELHPSNLSRSSSSAAAAADASSRADVAATERAMQAMVGFGEDEELLDEIDGVEKRKSKKGKKKEKFSGVYENALAELNTPDDDAGEALGDGIDGFAGGFSKVEEDDDDDDDDDDEDLDEDEKEAAAAARRPWVEAASPWNDDDDDDDDESDDDDEEEEEQGDLRAYLPPSASSSSSRLPPVRRASGGGGGGGGGKFRVMAFNVEEEEGGNGNGNNGFYENELDDDLGREFDDGFFYNHEETEAEAEAAAASSSSSPPPASSSDPSMIDLITGERLSSLPAAASDASSAAADAPEDPTAAALERRRSEQRAFDAAFCAASEALQSRLVLGVRSEADAAAQTRAALYRRNSVQALRAEGAVLAGLVATPAGEAFGRSVFALSLPRKGGSGAASFAVQAAAAALARGEKPPPRKFQRPPRRQRKKEGEGGGEGEQEPAASSKSGSSDEEEVELPYHRFGKRDPVVLAPIRLSDPNARPLTTAVHGLSNLFKSGDGSGGNGKSGGRNGGRDDDFRGKHRLVNATVLDVLPDHLIVSVGAEAAEYLEEQSLASDVEGAFDGEGGDRRRTGRVVGWRVDADQPDTTTARQLSAVGMLGRPFAEVYGVSEAEAARETELLGERAGDMTQAEIERSARRRREKARKGGGDHSAVIGRRLPRQPDEEFSAFDEGLDPASPPSSSPWTSGELRVRSILLGDPDSRRKAETQPSWARQPAWQLAASKLLASEGPGVSGLNASQRAAISSALTSTLTLWQGPPGTGKTRTLVALLTILAKATRRESYAAADAGEEEEEALKEAGKCVPVLACGDTNAAADGLALGLAAAGVRVVRLGAPPVRSALRNKKGSGSGEDGTKEAVLATLSLEAIAARTAKGKEAERARAVAARASARARAASAAEDAAALAADANPDSASLESSREEARQASNTARQEARDARAEAARLAAEAADQVLLLAEVVCSTTATAGDQRRLGPNIVFRCVVLDEATQATEPSTLIPLVRGCEACVLAGDPKQLPPTVTSAEAKGSGLQQTLFERLMRGGIEPFLLDTQYRMHPALSRFPSAAFYGDRLKDGESVLELARRQAPPEGFPWPAPGVPLAFVDADDCSESRGGGQGGENSSGSSSAGGSSLSNPGEVALTMRSAALLLQEKVRQEEEEAAEAEAERTKLLLEVEAAGGGEEEVAAALATAASNAAARRAARAKELASSSSSTPSLISSVAILSPYAGQIRLLRAALRLAPPRLRSKVVVSTVDGFQGREADAVVLSTVRSNARGSLGFLADPRRANVALTRARKALVVVGAPSTLAGGGSRSEGVWRDWLDYVSEMGAFLPGGALPLAPWEQVEEYEEDEEEEAGEEVAGEGEWGEPQEGAKEVLPFDAAAAAAPPPPPLLGEENFRSFGDTAGSVLEWGDVEEEFSVE